MTVAVVLTSDIETRSNRPQTGKVKGPKFYCQSEFQTGKIQEIEKAPIVSRSSANGTSSLFKATTTNKNIFALLQYSTLLQFYWCQVGERDSCPESAPASLGNASTK